MLLGLRNIARFYGPRLIFKDVSLDVRRGSVTLLAGANGAGKSTLLKIMAGLLRPSAGEVLLRETEAGQEPQVGYLGHQTFLYPELSALENLRFWASWHRLSLQSEAYEDILARVELTPFAEEKAGVFSRGMAQRLNLARVFLLAPDILLLDEPGTGLDTRSTAILHREIETARKGGAGVVWITHHLAEDYKRADMVALLEGKGLRFHGTAREFVDSGLFAGAAGSRPAPAPESAETRAAQGGEVC